MESISFANVQGLEQSRLTGVNIEPGGYIYIHACVSNQPTRDGFKTSCIYSLIKISDNSLFILVVFFPLYSVGAFEEFTVICVGTSFRSILEQPNDL